MINVRSAIALLFFPAFSVFALHSNYPCNQKIVQAVTQDSAYEIRICLTSKGVSYTEHRRGQKTPEIDILIPAHQARFEHTRYYQTLEINNGPDTYRYEFFPELDIRKQRTGLISINDIYVYRNSYPQRTLHLPKNTRHHITPALSQHGLIDMTYPRRKTS